VQTDAHTNYKISIEDLSVNVICLIRLLFKGPGEGERLSHKIVSGIILALVLISMSTSALNVQQVKASPDTIYIRADGSVYPSTAPISSIDNITYTLTDNIYDPIVVERNNIVVNGAGYTVQGTGSGTGIRLSGISNVTIKNMEITTFYYGIRLGSSSYNSIVGNNITNNNEGINLVSSSNYNIISGNNITNNWYGIWLDYSSSNSISGNSVTNNNYDGIHLESSSSNTISVNNIKNNNCGIYLDYCASNSISGNNITNNWYGIYLVSSSSNSISGNNITNNAYGIYLESSSSNTISVNNIKNNSHDGIHFYSSSNYNPVSGNNITNNGKGITLDSSSNNNKFYHNFISNTQQVVAGGTNTWDDGYPSGGNYWGDYTDIDLYSGPYQNETGNDGIWDHPYIINANNRDRYPLVKPYEGLHDIGITNITTSKTIIIQGDSLNINIKIINYGVETETFNVTAYANTTAVNQTRITLTSRKSTIITLAWNTTGVSLGFRTISAYASPVAGETYTADNTYTDGIVKIIKYPVSAFTYSPTTPLTSQTVTFNASLSTPNGITIVSYFWTFGDGANATGKIATHAYTDDGTYNVTLTVTNNDGLNNTNSQNITVLNRPPVASFTESATTVLTGTTITFNASTSYDPDGTIVSYFWDFGDGTNATGVTVDHSYSDDGTYTVTLTVTDDDGATDTATSIKTVLNRPPAAIFTESAETVYTGEVIYFNASDSFDVDGTVVSYFWDFGDGSNATGVLVSHAYAGKGTYTVTLTVTDDDGVSASTKAIKTILKRPDIAVTKVTTSKTVVGQGYNVSITVTVENQGDYTETFNVTVYAKTTAIVTQTVTLTSGNSKTITFTWNTTGFAKGNYTIWAYAWPVPYETDIEDNTLTNGWIVVTVIGDINGDFKVDVKDLVLVIKYFGSYPGHPTKPWNPNADINGDGKVDVKDLVLVIKHFGQHDP